MSGGKFMFIKKTIKLSISNNYFFFFNDTATTEIYTLSLHDALPISISGMQRAIAIGPLIPGIAPAITPTATPVNTNNRLNRFNESTNPAKIISNILTPEEYTEIYGIGAPRP